MKILLCDSDTTTRAALLRLLSQIEGCEVDVCASGAEVIERLERERFDLLMLDTDLPLLDGFETLALIRQAEALRHLPTVIVTRDRSMQTVLRSREFGVIDYLVKPVRHQRLLPALDAVRARARSDGRRTLPPPLAAPPVRQRTLIVDGDDGFRDALREMLAPHCDVATAPTGAAALNEAWLAVPDVALIGRDLGAIGPVPLSRYLSKLGTEGLVKIASPGDIATESESGAYTGVVGRSQDPGVVLRDLRRFLKLPTLHVRGTLQQLLDGVPQTRDLIVRVTAEVFSARLSTDIDVRDAGTSDVLGAHALVDMVLGTFGVRLAVQSTTELIRRLADAGVEREGDLQSSVGVLGEIASGLAGAIHAAATDAGMCGELGDPRFAAAAAARDGLPDDAERMVVEMAPVAGEGRFRVALDVYVRPADAIVPAPEQDEERLTA